MDRDEMRETVKNYIFRMCGHGRETLNKIYIALQALLDREQELSDKCERLEEELQGEVKTRITVVDKNIRLEKENEELLSRITASSMCIVPYCVKLNKLKALLCEDRLKKIVYDHNWELVNSISIKHKFPTQEIMNALVKAIKGE